MIERSWNLRFSFQNQFSDRRIFFYKNQTSFENFSFSTSPTLGTVLELEAFFEMPVPGAVKDQTSPLAYALAERQKKLVYGTHL